MASSKAATSILLETNGRRQHRLVIIRSGLPLRGPWCEAHQVGRVKGLYHHVGAAGDCPSVFRVTAVAHEVLEG